MPMIQGIDGGLLINALRQGRNDRYEDDARAFKMAQAKAEADRQGRIDSARNRATGMGGVPNQNSAMAPTSGGVLGQAAPAFAGGVMGQMGAPTADASAPAAPQMAPSRPRVVDQQAMNEWLVLDPESAGKFMAGLKNMDEAEVKRFQVRNDAMASAALYLRKLPPDQRPGAFKMLMPRMMEAGWTEEELADADLDDMALMGYAALGMDYEKAVKQDLEERKFRAPKTVAVAPGGSLINVTPVLDGTGNITGTKAEYAVEPFQGGGEQPQGEAGIAQPKSKAEYDALPPGAQYRDPNGVLRMKPGGGSGNAASGFPG